MALASQHVLSDRDWLEVFGSHAEPRSTKVIECQPGRNRTNECLVAQTVSQLVVETSVPGNVQSCVA